MTDDEETQLLCAILPAIIATYAQNEFSNEDWAEHIVDRAGALLNRLNRNRAEAEEVKAETAVERLPEIRTDGAQYAMDGVIDGWICQTHGYTRMTDADREVQVKETGPWRCPQCPPQPLKNTPLQFGSLVQSTPTDVDDDILF